MKNPIQQNRTMLAYGAAIVLLFVGMVPYSLWLDRVKDEKDLGEATLGQVDTGSFMLKLALLGGARGVAANVLWTRAIDLQKVQEWDRLKQTVDLITKLQPHFLAVWTFQSWNLAYNVSVEWDAPEDKYYWIKQGIKFVKDGVDKNRKSPDLIWDTASYYYHKLGFADEAVILRRLFRDDEDEDFKTDPVERLPRDDNFQVAHGWFTKAVDLVDSGQTRLATQLENEVNYVDPPTQRKGRPGDLNFRSMPAHAQTRYAAGLEKESIVGVPATFGEVARNEWSKALAEWAHFADYSYLSPNALEIQGEHYAQPIRIGDVDRVGEIEARVGDLAYWTEQLDEANSKELPKLTEEECRRLAENKLHWSNRWADQMNYPYWTDRCRTEMEPQGVRARQLFYEGTKAFKAGDFPAAGERFKEGLALWQDLLEKHPVYRNDDLNERDTGLIVRRYTQVLANLSEPIPDDLPFKDLLELDAEGFNPDPFDASEVRTNR